jgi:zinc transporter ZupT
LIPLAIAICIHNLLDGWTAAISAYTTSNVGSGIALGLMAHKLPEAVVFGLMLRAATDRPNVALLSACATASAILVGGAAHSRGLWMVPEAVVIAASLALACSSFLFAGAHIFLRQQRHAGRRAAIGPLLLGLFVSAVFEQVVSIALGQWQ